MTWQMHTGHRVLTPGLPPLLGKRPNCSCSYTVKLGGGLDIERIEHAGWKLSDMAGYARKTLTTLTS